jgi:hypothetical protein
MQDAFRAAVDNITKHGDTDVFPYPIENHVFFDKREEVVKLLLDIHKDLKNALAANPPVIEGMLTSAGYTGFRWATQIDPVWNAYMLGLVISEGERIEVARIEKSREVVFSYRFQWEDADKTVFDKSYGWIEFQRKSVEHAKKYKHVLVCDIADFYPRIYHHRLENALRKATSNSDSCWRIMELLKHISKGVSYGLPVGGPAARLLSELLLNRIDRLLLAKRISFCRFADDYHIFADSAEEAYQHLVYLSERLLENEGLLLQKMKTRVMSSGEFLATSEFASENVPESPDERESREFLRIRLHYDPYSQTADEDYRELKSELSKFDVTGMLAREMRKSRIHQALSKKLIGAVRHLEPTQRDGTIISITENLGVLYPIFPSIMLLIKSLVHDLSTSAREAALGSVRDLIGRGSHIALVPTHLAYAVRLLAYDNSEEADEILARVYREINSSAIRRDIILAMGRRNADYWVSDVRKSFYTATPWERTAIIVSSYILGDEGSHWRTSIRSNLTPMQTVVKQWAAEKSNSTGWEIPV